MKPGDIVENGWASKENPLWRSIVIKDKGGIVVCTDGKGGIWDSPKGPKLKVIGHVTLSPIGQSEGESSEKKRPTIVCLCGSTRFLDAYKATSLQETMMGKIVLSIGCDMRTDKFFFSMGAVTKKQFKEQLDELHLRKIDLADEILVLNVGGYVGKSTAQEIAYAEKQGKGIRYLEAKHTPKPGADTSRHVLKNEGNEREGEETGGEG